METTGTMSDQAVSMIKDLVRLNVDSYKGFEAAAEQVSDPDVARLFRAIAQQRRLFAEQLRRHVELSDDEAGDRGGIAKQFHRWWSDLESMFQSGDLHGVLTEAERGEDVVCDRYEAALARTDAYPIHSVLQQQYMDIRDCHDQIRDMRDEVA